MEFDPFDVPLNCVALFYPTVASFGGGLNSTAALVKWVMDGNHPLDKIIFADTGGERPDVYEHVARFNDWLVAQGMPAIEITRKGGRQESLEEYSLRIKMLPSMAYGRMGCSHKFKIQPQERDINRWAPARAAWKRGDKVVKIIGYGYEEQRRIALAKTEDEKYLYRFPLNEWRVDREGCEQIIRAAGLPVPGKSSCFFCPSMRKPEILLLRDTHPELLQRALRIEQVGMDGGRTFTSKGLGRRFRWSEYLAGEQVQEAPEQACMYCADGEPSEQGAACTTTTEEEDLF